MARPRIRVSKLDVDTELMSVKTLTLGEAAELEKALGTTIGKIEQESTAAVTAVMWLSARRHNRALTLADFQGLTLADVDITVPDGGEDVDPSQPAAPDNEAADEPKTSPPESSSTPSA